MLELLQGSSEELSFIDFINWLTTRTVEGRLLWERRPNMVTTTLQGSLLVQFVTSVCENDTEAWRLFTVCNGQGDEVYRVTDLTANNGVPPDAPAIDGLFLAAIGVSRVH
jgi:hypothetical protein